MSLTVFIVSPCIYSMYKNRFKLQFDTKLWLRDGYFLLQASPRGHAHLLPRRPHPPLAPPNRTGHPQTPERYNILPSFTVSQAEGTGVFFFASDLKCIFLALSPCDNIRMQYMYVTIASIMYMWKTYMYACVYTLSDTMRKHLPFMLWKIYRGMLIE